MNNMKNTTKKKQTKKVAKPAYVVDLTGVSGEFDASLRIALCKYENKIGDFNSSNIYALKQYAKMLSMTYAINNLINRNELTLIGCGVFYSFPIDTADLVVTGVKIVETNKKKPNIFKRFWNWITRKK